MCRASDFGSGAPSILKPMPWGFPCSGISINGGGGGHTIGGLDRERKGANKF